MVCDVSDADAVEALAATTYERFGAAHLVCANAGVFQGGISWERSVEDWQWVLGVNLWGVIHAVKAFVPRMIEGGDEGHVVVTSSMAGLACAAFSGPYQTSKFGAYAVAESLAHDLRASGIPIGVSALCPGAVNTRIAGSTRNRPERTAGQGRRGRRLRRGGPGRPDQPAGHRPVRSRRAGSSPACRPATSSSPPTTPTPTSSGSTPTPRSPASSPRWPTSAEPDSYLVHHGARSGGRMHEVGSR